MYQPPHHREDRLEVQHALIRAHPLGTLVTIGGVGARRQCASLHPRSVARPSEHCRRISRAPTRNGATFDPRVDALVIFQGVESYITPSWYATKQEHGKGGADLELCDRAGVGADDG